MPNEKLLVASAKIHFPNTLYPNAIDKRLVFGDDSTNDC